MEYIRKQIVIQPHLNEIIQKDAEGNIRYHGYEVRYRCTYYKFSKKYKTLEEAIEANKEHYIKSCVWNYEINYKNS